MIRSIIEYTGMVIELLGVLIIVAGTVIVIIQTIFKLPSSSDISSTISGLRKKIGMAILLGLEFLVAGDIIRTVLVRPSLKNIGLLGAIVAIRTFLSFSLEIEMTGRLPWRRPETDNSQEQTEQDISG